MIYTTLTFIRDVLNESFKNEFSMSENKVVLSNLANSDGSLSDNTEDKIVFFLLNFDEETSLKNNLSRLPNSDSGSFTQRKPTIHLNLYLAFCANFTGKNYSEGLRYISSLIRFFQRNNNLHVKSNNGISIDNKLQFELCKLDYTQLSHVWSSIGSKILPSAIYKLRLISMEDTSVSRVVPAIQDPQRQA